MNRHPEVAALAPSKDDVTASPFEVRRARASG